MAAQEDEQDDATRPQVTLRPVSFRAVVVVDEGEGLRADIHGGAAHRLHTAVPSHAGRQPKIGNFHARYVAGIQEKKVLEFEISVGDAAVVQVRNARQYRAQNRPSVFLRQTAALHQRGQQLATRYQLEDHVHLVSFEKVLLQVRQGRVAAQLLKDADLVHDFVQSALAVVGFIPWRREPQYFAGPFFSGLSLYGHAHGGKRAVAQDLANPVALPDLAYLARRPAPPAQGSRLGVRIFRLRR
mmetsp:Transcript_1910/g.4981  ORF Transcript_1910/g.4981 Transcript_1910/m.4981 type:complete len:242 (-) Transcript_1910:338-1063(-)